MARKFYYICASMLMLALAYQLGASTAQGQGAGSVLDADDRAPRRETFQIPAFDRRSTTRGCSRRNDCT